MKPQSSDPSCRDKAAPGDLLARGREAEIWDTGDGAVLKLYLPSSKDGAAQREASVLTALSSAGLPVPAVLDEVVVDGRQGLVLERISGTDLLSRIGRRPWTALNAGQALARIQASLNDVRAPAGLPSLVERLRSKLAGSPRLGDSTRTRMLELLEVLADGDRLCHGDLHLENVLGTSSKLVVIDWSNAAAGPPAADVARTLVVLGFGEPPVEAPTIVRLLGPRVRRNVISRYLDTYLSIRPLDLDSLREWQVIQAAARMGETTDDESAVISSWLKSQGV